MNRVKSIPIRSLTGGPNFRPRLTRTCLLLLLATLLMLSCRDRHGWDETIQSTDGETLKVEFEYSKKATLLDCGHFGIIGGGDERYGFSIRRTKSIRHKSKYEGRGKPTVLDLYEGALYMVTWDRSNFLTLKYEPKKREWKVIPHPDFPKSIAIPNTKSALSYYNRYEKKHEAYLDPTSPSYLDTDGTYMRSSLTAKLWYYLVTGENYYETRSSSQKPTSEFIGKYKKDWLSK